MRNTPDALEFIKLPEEQGVAAAVARRDGPFGDYSQAAPEDQPNPATWLTRNASRTCEEIWPPVTKMLEAEPNSKP